MFIKILILTFLINVGHGREQFLTSCPKSDPNVNFCLKNLFNLISSRFGSGFPELGVKSLDPTFFKHIPLNISGIFDVKGQYHNVTLKGLAGVQITEVKSDLEKYRIDLRIVFRSFEVRGVVDAVGRLIILPFRNHGDFVGTGHGVTALYKLKFKPIVQSGATYLLLDNSQLDFTVKEFKIYNNDYNSKILGQAITQILNENALEYFKLLKPTIGGALGSVLDDAIRKIFLAVPENQIFP